jgi:hypothetical protein
MTQTKYSFKSLVVAYVIASAFFHPVKFKDKLQAPKMRFI